ncbi:nad binding protein [Nannochloropsis oceanica]
MTAALARGFGLPSSLLPQMMKRRLPRQFSSSSTSTTSTSTNDDKSNFSSGPKIVVLGGSGYVGRHVLQAALNRGADAVSINRSGKPEGGQASGSWLSQVKWVASDVFDSNSWAKELEGAVGVVSCIGAFGSNAFMERINGDANVLAVETAAKAGVPHFVYVSTVENNLPDFILKGYFKGKKRAEEAVLKSFPGRKGMVLRPSFVYGTRQVGSLSLPLAAVGRPMELLFRLPPFPSLRQTLPGTQALLAPPVSVQAVATVAAAGALGDGRVKEGEGEREGVLSVDDIVRLARIV